MSRTVNIITALIGLVIMLGFVLGLSYSISIGFAGFWGGLPFMLIAIAVICLALYNFWEDALRNKD